MFRDDLAEVDPGAGFLVEVFDPDARRLGLAAWSPASKISLRFLSADPDLEIRDRGRWFSERIGLALERRAPLEQETDSYRVAWSEADGLPGLIADRYADVVVLQTLNPFMEEHLDHIVPALVELLRPRMVLARNDSGVRAYEGLPRRIELCHGTRVESVSIREHELELRVDPFRGQKTGYYLDQRPARKLVERLSSESEGRVLDLFCHTGSFALHAARGGASEVIAVDSSEKALEECAAAAERNSLSNVHTQRGNAFAVLKSLQASGETFDGIVLDPPAFAKRREDLSSARRGYRDINSRAMRLLRHGGWLVTSSCSANLRPEDFHRVLSESAGRAGRSFVDRGRLQVAMDHPVLLTLPESDYLKVHHLQAPSD